MHAGDNNKNGLFSIKVWRHMLGAKKIKCLD